MTCDTLNSKNCDKRQHESTSFERGNRLSGEFELADFCAVTKIHIETTGCRNPKRNYQARYPSGCVLVHNHALAHAHMDR